MAIGLFPEGEATILSPDGAVKNYKSCASGTWFAEKKRLISSSLRLGDNS